MLEILKVGIFKVGFLDGRIFSTFSFRPLNYHRSQVKSSRFYDNGGILICGVKMKFLKVRGWEAENGLRFVRMEAAYSNKRPLLFRIEAMVEDSRYRYHQCNSCFFNKRCDKQCGIIESSKGVQEFVREKFGIGILNLSIVPLIVKKYKNVQIPKF